MSIPKLAFVILLLAVLLFVVAPNVSWAKCRPRDGGKMQVPVMYAIFVLDFKILKWEAKTEPSPSSGPRASVDAGQFV